MSEMCIAVMAAACLVAYRLGQLNVEKQCSKILTHVAVRLSNDGYAANFISAMLSVPGVDVEVTKGDE